jgi:hypothetical protein
MGTATSPATHHRGSRKEYSSVAFGFVGVTCQEPILRVVCLIPATILSKNNKKSTKKLPTKIDPKRALKSVSNHGAFKSTLNSILTRPALIKTASCRVFAEILKKGVQCGGEEVLAGFAGVCLDPRTDE